MPLPLREYYPVKRASELLECTLDDLLHWAEIGSIRLHVKVDNAKGVFCRKDLVEFLELDKFESIIENTEYHQRISDLRSSFDDEDDYNDNEINEFIYENASLLYKSMVFNIQASKGLSGIISADLFHEYAYLHFMFSGGFSERFSNLIAADIRKEDPMYAKRIPEYESNSTVLLEGFFSLGADFYKNSNYRNKFVLNENDFQVNLVHMPQSQLGVYIIVDCDVEIKESDLYILKNDFVTIQDAINSGKEMPQHPYDESREPINNDESNKMEFKKPYIKEMHASKRESVLKAAIYMMVNHPNLCENNTKWAEAINDYAHKFWADGKCPLSLEVTAKLLGKALNPTK